MANRSSHDMMVSTTSRLSAPRILGKARFVGETPFGGAEMEDEISLTSVAMSLIARSQAHER